jgi:hypothetical protein
LDSSRFPSWIGLNRCGKYAMTDSPGWRIVFDA